MLKNCYENILQVFDVKLYFLGLYNKRVLIRLCLIKSCWLLTISQEGIIKFRLHDLKYTEYELILRRRYALITDLYFF